MCPIWSGNLDGFLNKNFLFPILDFIHFWLKNSRRYWVERRLLSDKIISPLNKNLGLYAIKIKCYHLKIGITFCSIEQSPQLKAWCNSRSYTADRDRFKAQLQDSQEFMAYMMGHNATLGRNATIGGGTMSHLPGSAATIGLGTLGHSGPPSLLLANLRHVLAQALQQNSLMRAKLQRIHADSDFNDLQPVNLRQLTQ